MSGSLRGRLFVLLALLVAAALTSGTIMVGLFRQSATAQAGQAEALVDRACDAIVGAFRFYTAGARGPVSSEDAALRHDLTTVVQTALRGRPGIEGGIWQAEAGPLAYAFPTYEGSGPKTDLPEAELPRIKAINLASAANDRAQASRYDANSQTLLLSACPLPGPTPGLTGWAMTRVHTFAGRNYQQLMAGLGVLLASVLAAVALSIRLAVTWSRHVSHIETALNAHDIADLPVLSKTGERELDRVVLALNEAGRRLLAARQRAEQLSRQVATGERLAAIGRVAAGVAHEIRNPIAAMRLKAENAKAGGVERQSQALSVILEQVDRLDALLRRLLNVTERDEPRRERVALLPFLESCVAAHGDVAAARRVTLKCSGIEEVATFDPDQMRRAIDNLVLNAIQAAPAGSRIQIDARRAEDMLVLSVHDEGHGPPPEIRDHLFEPFVTGRVDGTGLGLSIVREVAEAHGGTARLARLNPGTTFEIVVPWQSS
jgi:signal transduction histidine kinase